MPSMLRDELNAVVESFLLTARGPVTALSIVESINEADVTQDAVEEILQALQQEWDQPRRGLRLERVAGG